ncbi:hypothetical protein [Catelliglobosispora koreensis]|uniref:hypothetical protein n=1 Tax=Catelliglobosispora koreensis TaxID=129052 RepID=UPI00035E5AE6|nr:hypothetical protein [Catelliglobosispora koreensis]
MGLEEDAREALERDRQAAEAEAKAREVARQRAEAAAIAEARVRQRLLTELIAIFEKEGVPRVGLYRRGRLWHINAGFGWLIAEFKPAREDRRPFLDPDSREDQPEIPGSALTADGVCSFWIERGHVLIGSRSLPTPEVALELAKLAQARKLPGQRPKRTR